LYYHNNTLFKLQVHWVSANYGYNYFSRVVRVDLHDFVSFAKVNVESKRNSKRVLASWRLYYEAYLHCILLLAWKCAKKSTTESYNVAI